MMKKGFTLLELVVVIIILGVLATLGITQYGRMVEKGRKAEAYAILGECRKLAFAYRLANGTITGITDADLNIGGASDQIPRSCRSSHYFKYCITHTVVDPEVQIGAFRCNSGEPGKEPQGLGCGGCATVALCSNLVTGADGWQHDCGCGYACP